MIKDIEKIIAENLSTATANEMSKFITEAKQTKDDLKNVTSELEEALDSNIALDTKCKKLTVILQFQTDIDVRKKELAVWEEKLRITNSEIELKILRVKFEEAERSNRKLESMVEKVLGHPGVIVTSSKSTPVMFDPGNGGAPYQNGSAMEMTETKTTEVKE